MFPLLAFVLYCAVFLGKYSSRLFSLKLMTLTGGMCYTIYLYHGAVISAFGRITTSITVTSHFSINAVVQTAILTVPVIVVSALLFLLVERPCMDRTWPEHLHARIVKWGQKSRAPLSDPRQMS